MRLLCRIICVLCLLIVPTLVVADVVIDWDNVALNLIRENDLRPTNGSRMLAMMHAAMYDSVNNVYQNYEPYYVCVDPPRNTSAVAAAATAAHDVLVYQFPQDKCALDWQLAGSLRSVTNTTAKNNGVTLGHYVAGKIIAWRRNDGADETVPYTPGQCPGDWRPTPPNYAPAVAPNWPYVEPFCVPNIEEFTPGPPPALTSREYAEAVNEVAKLGSVNSRYRTEDQTEIAWFWADDFDSVSPPGRWDLVAQIAAERMQNTLEDNARLFALINIAMADGAICCWSCKYEYNLWRPITAIREADTDRNPLTTKIPGWTPLLTTPAFPAYTSGHSTFGAAAAEILIRFYGRDNFPFKLESTSPNAGPRYFRSFSEAAEENGLSRIYGGIHFGLDNMPGIQYGIKIGDYAFDNILRPL